MVNRLERTSISFAIAYPLDVDTDNVHTERTYVRTEGTYTMEGT